MDLEPVAPHVRGLTDSKVTKISARRQVFHRKCRGISALKPEPALTF
jgi:hypothetical protein